MASYTLKIYDVPQENKNIELSYNSNNGRSTGSSTIGDSTWNYTLQSLSYSKAIYKPGELIFKLQITGCSGVNAIYSTFKGKKVELTAKADNQENSIAKDYYIFGIQIEKKGNVYYATFQAYDPLKYLTLDTYCKAYTGKKLISDIISNTTWPNNIPQVLTTALKSTQQNIKDINNIKKDINELKKEIDDLKADNKDTTEKENARTNKIAELQKKENEAFILLNAHYLTYITNNDYAEFIQPYLVQYNESFFDFLVRVSNRCGEFLYYEKGHFNIGWKKEIQKKGQDKEYKTVTTAINEYVSVNFSDETTTAWKESYIVNSHHNYPDRAVKDFPFLPLDTAKLTKKYTNAKIIIDDGINLTISYEGSGKDGNGKPKEESITVKRSEYETTREITLRQDSHLASDENLVSLPPKDKYTKWTDFALWPGCYLINVFTDIVNSTNIAEAIINVLSSTAATSTSSKVLAGDANDNYEKEYFNNENDIYKEERKNGDHIHPFSTSEENKNTTLSSYVTFSLEFYETVRKGIETNERSRIQIALGDHFYPLSLGSLIELDGQQYIVVQMNGCASSDAEALDIEAIPYKENEFVFPPAAPVGPIREAKAQRAFITHNTDPLKMNRVRVRYPWQGQTEDPTPWIRIALPMASDGSGFNFLPQIGDEAIINYENGNIEKPYVEGMLYTRAAKEDESTVPYAFKRDKARVISSVNGHSIIFSDPSASSDALNSLSPLMSTIKSFCPTGFIRTELTLSDHKPKKLPDSFKKAMGGIEFTDEHGLYSISMSSDKRAISIDSPLGKVDINAFTGITISAPNGNVRIEGKNIDIVAGNNLSISSGNNIVSHFWPTSVQLLKESLKDTAVNALKKIQPIDMGLIRTFMETLIRPIGGTMLIKSNRYLCIEAGKGEAKIPGRNLQLRGTALWTGGVKHKETASFFGDIVAAHQFIIELFNTCKANTIAINAQKVEYEGAQRNAIQQNSVYQCNPVPKNFNNLISDILNNISYQPSKPIRKEGKDNAKQLNDAAKKLYKLVKKSVWDNVIESLNKSLSDTCKNALDQCDREIKRLCENIYFLDAQNAYIQNFDANATIDIEVFRSVILYFIFHLNTHNPYHITISNLPAQISDNYPQNTWNSLFTNDDPQNLHPILTLDLTNNQFDVPKIPTDSKLRLLTKACGLNGYYDQYNWDHASGGDILFSREEGKTLYLDNNTINEYTLANKMQQIIDFLRNI